ncbi:MAG: sulfite exporter TauE/SafE family protein, partial [Microbacterium gubbeenense]|uniref:sulfite exporter TauE/SafE family protein n=1 Tax=Microbacterium gubbeenense TaxID=159896 RepID=UPI003F94F6AA
MSVGISKTGLPGSNSVGIALFAAVLPARESTAAMLLLLILGDMLALSLYRRHADWRTLLRLTPSVIAGLVIGAAFLAFVGDAWVKRSIGVLLIGVVALTLWRRRAQQAAENHSGRGAAIAYGSLGGFTTMVANAGGPVMSMYFLASRFSVNAFLGTAAWFFAVINIVKLPVSISLGLITQETLWMDLLLVIPVLLGAVIGRAVVTRISRKTFDRIVIVLTLAGAV